MPFRVYIICQCVCLCETARALIKARYEKLSDGVASERYGRVRAAKYFLCGGWGPLPGNFVQLALEMIHLYETEFILPRFPNETQNKM